MPLVNLTQTLRHHSHYVSLLDMEEFGTPIAKWCSLFCCRVLQHECLLSSPCSGSIVARNSELSYSSVCPYHNLAPQVCVVNTDLLYGSLALMF